MILCRQLSLLRFSFTTQSLLKYIQPVKLKTQTSQQMPILQLKSEKHLLKNWWSQSPFELTESQPMKVPVFSFAENIYTSQTIQLPQQIFNYPLRRDLLHRLYDFRIKLDKFRTKKTRNRAMTYGSGRKCRPQKGQGRARQGDSRAPHLKKGGKAHGAKPMVYSYPLNSKIKINALKALLSAKLSEGKIKIIDTEQINEAKTKILSKNLQKHSTDDRTLFCIITHQERDDNFERAHRNIKRLMWHDTYNLDVLSIFKADKILITKKGLEQLVDNLYKTIYMAYSQPHMPKLGQKEEVKQEQEVIRFDPNKPYDYKFKILAEYMQNYRKLKEDRPDLLERETERVRKAQI